MEDTYYAISHAKSCYALSVLSLIVRFAYFYFSVPSLVVCVVLSYAILISSLFQSWHDIYRGVVI